MNYEVIITDRFDVLKQRSIGRFLTNEEATETADKHARENPLTACYVFAWLTARTRILTHHTL